MGKASCGDVIKLQIEVDEATGNIKDAKFKTFGCGSAIASSSVATEMIIGKNVNDAVKLRNTDISAHLNLPPVKIHCSVLAEEAIWARVAHSVALVGHTFASGDILTRSRTVRRTDAAVHRRGPTPMLSAWRAGIEWGPDRRLEARLRGFFSRFDIKSEITQ